MALCATGVCSGNWRILWNDVDLGETSEGININTEYFGTNIIGDRLGDTVVNIINRGMSAMVTCDYIEYRDAIEGKIFHAWIDQNVTATDEDMAGASRAGLLMGTYAKTLKLVPSANAVLVWDVAFAAAGAPRAGDTPQIWATYALLTGSTSLPLGNMVAGGPLEFTLLPDATNDDRLFYYKWS